MSKFYLSITEEQETLIRNAPLFFVASVDPRSMPGSGLKDAADTAQAGSAKKGEDPGPVNVSPKGGSPLHVLGPNRVAYVDFLGSGNETARHVQAGGPVTLMVCSFEEQDAAIVRLYGRAVVRSVDDAALPEGIFETKASQFRFKARQVIDVDVEKTMTSCGYGVPILEPVRERSKAEWGRKYK
ncbi:MAG: pyridoxamine 5'-phosphate oxidase family protein [Gemmatimonadetes bacterium]|nr:pyridoxamine 5'-phosphate oxidase family protein [Gemmatimonadota bacterium]